LASPSITSGLASSRKGTLRNISMSDAQAFLEAPPGQVPLPPSAVYPGLIAQQHADLALLPTRLGTL